MPNLILITHDPVDVSTWADSVVVLDKERVVARGRPSEVAAAPGSSWAAQFLGANVVKGTAQDVNVTTKTGFELITATPATGDVYATFAAHSVTLHPEMPSASSARNVWRGTVERVETDHAMARVSFASPLVMRADITAKSAQDLELVPGSGVWVSVKATEVSVVS